jgi:septal ring factor EnvC (AmiA/AmiB activator)
MVRALADQLDAITGEVSNTTADLVRAEDELTLQRAMLRPRLVDISTRGPLYDMQVVLSAETFGSLVSRYKYLHLLTLRDRALVKRVEDLRVGIDKQRSNLVRFQDDMEQNKQEKAQEEERLRALERERGASLAQARRSAKETEARLARIARDEAKLAGVIASLETARLKAEASRPNTPRAPKALHTADFGNLDWPVQGTIIYSFGRVVSPNNTTTRWNGIGIAAPSGTPVHSVMSGKVAVAAALGTYGLTVIVDHGGGDYSVYGSLSKLSVNKGDVVSKGEVIGYVGSSDPDLQPHLHFEMRPESKAVDPLEWLKSRH